MLYSVRYFGHALRNCPAGHTCASIDTYWEFVLIFYIIAEVHLLLSSSSSSSLFLLGHSCSIGIVCVEENAASLFAVISRVSSFASPSKFYFCLFKPTCSVFCYNVCSVKAGTAVNRRRNIPTSYTSVSKSTPAKRT